MKINNNKNFFDVTMNNICIYNKHSEHSINQAMDLLWFYSGWTVAQSVRASGYSNTLPHGHEILVRVLFYVNL